MAAIIAAAKDPSYGASIACVISNRPDAKGLALAEAAHVPAITINHQDFSSREAFEEAVDATLKAHQVELVVLAGFMRILTPHFITRWEGRLINIHPSLLPSYRGLHTHERALADGVKLHGCTVHFVVPELDAGPIIAQAALAVRPDDNAETLAARLLTVENRLYPQIVSAMGAGLIRLKAGLVEIDAPAAEGSFLSLA